MLVSSTALEIQGQGIGLKSVIQIIATGFGTGYSPVAPGSVGTLVGIPVYLLLAGYSWPFHLLGIVVLSWLAVYTAGVAETAFGQKDPGMIVIDEIAGFQLALFMITPTLWHVVGGYVLFRIFDIVKVFPANICDAKLPGGYGIVADDIVAGIYANIVLQLAIRLISL
jgi:phosphatidylglycerophosphatase A